MADNRPEFVESRKRGFDVSDANPWHILASGVGLLIVIGLCLIAVAILLAWRDSGANRGTPLPGFEHGTVARTSIEEDRAEMDSETETHLRGYRWIDRDRGVVQVPIERAMELIAGESEGKP